MEGALGTQVKFRDLIPYDRASAPRNSMSSITGKDKQPFHTDAAFDPQPPRYVVLYCLDPGEADCPTNLLSVDLASKDVACDSRLRRQFWIFRGGGNSSFYAPILEIVDGQYRLRFDPLCMRPASQDQITKMQVEALLKENSRSASVWWKRGDLLIIDNWRCLHARGKGAENTPSRLLRRWMIGAENGLVV